METDEMARRRARRLDNSRLRKYRDKNAPKVSKSFSLFSYIYFTVLVDTRYIFILLYCWEREKREINDRLLLLIKSWYKQGYESLEVSIYSYVMYGKYISKFQNNNI